ncbi:MAG TPA: baseplate J/gp47 family protein, partial [Polyangia bacterium]|nr:baseplate J/gp47 family protein [Polyangia bacterium]
VRSDHSARPGGHSDQWDESDRRHLLGAGLMPFTSDPQTISDLLPPLATDDVRRFLMAFLAVPQNKVTDWFSGAVQRTMMELEAAIITDAAGNMLPALAAQGYPGDAAGDSLTTLARGWFEVARALPTVAKQQITISCDATHGPYVISAGRLRALTSDGVTYNAASGGTVAPGGQLALLMQAETPGSAHGLIVSLADAFPGVTVVTAAIAVVGGVSQFGSDGDGDATVSAEISARFPPLDDAPSEQDRVVAWAIAAVATITRWRLDPDGTYPGAVLLTLANATGGISGGEVTTVQAALDAHAPITDVITAQAAVNHTVDVDTTTALVTCPAAILSSAKAAADAAWVASLSAAAVGGKVYLTALIKAVMDSVGPAGNITGAALVGAGIDHNVALSSTQVPVAGVLPSAMTWKGI